MEWAGGKERFGNTPENEICPDLSKLNPGSSLFQAMVLTHHFDGYAVISEAGTASEFGLFRAEVWHCIPRSDHAVVPEAALATKFAKQPIKVWAGPLCGPQIAQQSEKAGKRQMGARFHLTVPSFFVSPDGSLQPCNPSWRKQQGSTNQPTSPMSLFCTAFCRASAIGGLRGAIL